MQAAIIIPARYGSSRFPGKPLAKLAGKTLLQHVCEAAKKIASAQTIVATDDQRIFEHAAELGVLPIMTPESCSSGTDRVLATLAQLPTQPDYVINLQGDSPLTQTSILQQMFDQLKTSPVVTPVLQLTWQALDHLRNNKATNPFSGTFAIVNKNDEGVWFSKQIIPAIRNEQKLRAHSELSPMYQHLGIYGYSRTVLHEFAALDPSHYEQLEGLEQLRFLENGYTIKTVKLDPKSILAWRGVDSPDDLTFVEKLILGNPLI